MKIAIHQPQFMPWTGYFHKMGSADLFVLLDDVQFKKNEWQHRNRIRNSKGWQWLSVPTTYRFPQLISEVLIDAARPWQKNHFTSLLTCYGKSAYADAYLPRFEEFYAQRPATLDKLNFESIRLLAGMIGIDTPLEISSAYNFDGVSTERLVSICRFFKADTYLAGSGGHDYMDLTLFEKAGIRVEFQEFTPPRYGQRWCRNENEFLPGLSAIDLVFNCGPQSRSVLMGDT